MGWIHRLGGLCIAVVSWFLDALHHIPDVVWAALIAALIAFGSTALSNRHARKQQQKQLNHDGLQRDRDRAMSLRRDVYLPAAEALARLQGALGRLTSAETNQEALGRQIITDLAMLAKIHLVAGESTIMALLNYQKAFTPAYLELIELRGPIVNRQRAIEQQQAFMNAAIAEHKLLIKLMREHNISNSTDGALMQRLTTQADRELAVHKTHSDQQSALWQEQRLAIANIGESLTEIIARTAALIPDALLSARKDFELPIDERKYRKFYAEQREAALNVMRGVVERVRNPSPVSAAPVPTTTARQNLE